VSRIFYSSKGKPCGILNSTWFMDKTFKQREKAAFSKSTYKDLDDVDRAQLSGYAHAIAERNRAAQYKYRKKHPNYTRKTKRTYRKKK